MSTRAGAFTGTGALVRLILRRDRFILPAWVFGATALTLGTAAAAKTSYDDPKSTASYAATVGDSAAGLITSGRNVALDTTGGIAVNESSFTTVILVSLMVLFTVVRHTRTEEETARAEVVRATAVGRHAGTLAATVVAIVAALFLGALTTISFLALGLGATGAMTYGLGIGLLGVCFAASTSAAAQASQTARGALGIGGLVIGGTFVVRGVGAVSDNFLVWLTPFGWAQEMHAYGTERYWPALILIAAALAAFALAAYLLSQRDFGAGLVQPKLASARASRNLHLQPWFSWRQLKGLTIGWTVGLIALAAVYGSVVTEIPAMLESTPEMAEIFGEGGEQVVIDGFLAYIFVFMAVVSSAYAISAVLRLRSEENSERAETLLATSVPRVRWAAGTLVVAVIATVALQALTGAAAGVVYAAMDSDWGHIAPAIGAALNFTPAVLTMLAFAFAVWGVTRTAYGWLLFAYTMVVTWIGELLKFPDWLMDLSPFNHVPQVPVDDFDVLPLVVLTLIAAALVAVGMVGLQRRDIRSN